ncbi:hypothetical protein B0H21DRAFT_828869, partial [Amylocystis lapponica]
MPSGSHEELSRAYTGLLQVVSTLQATRVRRGDGPTTRAEELSDSAKDGATGAEDGDTKSRRYGHYGLAKFETREKFETWRKSQRGASDINIAHRESGEGEEGADDDSGGKQCRYLEDDQGHTLSRARIDRMRDHARAIWNHFADNNRAPGTWSQAPLDVRNEFRTEMVSRFPELRLCDDDWKTDYLATKNYPNWHKRRYPKTPVIKDEHHGQSSRAKRTATSSSPTNSEDLPMPMPKKAKVTNAELTESEHDGIATNAAIDKGKGLAVVKSSVAGTEATESVQDGVATNSVIDKGKRPPLVLKNALSGLFKISSPGVDTGPLPTEATATGKSGTPPTLASNTIGSMPTTTTISTATVTTALDPSRTADSSGATLSAAGDTSSADAPTPKATQAPVTPLLVTESSSSKLQQPPVQPNTKSGSTKAGASNAKVYKPSLSTTARNLCGIEWKKTHPAGTTEDFANYYNGLLPGAKK